MKAIVCHKYGSPEVLQLEEVAKPVPKDKQILIKVHATAVNSADWRLRKPDPAAVRLFFGFFGPRKKILGGVLAGVVEAVGSKVTRFKVGDRVFGSAAMRFGAYAEYVALPENAILVKMPSKLDYADAAALPFGGLTALSFLQKVNIQKGDRVLVIGASGAVGCAAVQIAKALGAKVTGVCSAANVALVKSLGADEVLDYTAPGYRLPDAAYDVVYETVQSMPFAAKLAALKPRGALLMSDAGVGETLRALWTSWVSQHKVVVGMAGETISGMQTLSMLNAADKFRAVIDQRFPLERMADAHRYVEAGHKKGNVVINVVRE